MTPATTAAPAGAVHKLTDALGGLDPRDLRDYSFVKAAQIEAGVRRGAGTLERDVADVILAYAPTGMVKGFPVPTAQLVADTATAGQELVFESPLGWVPALRARSALGRLGAQIISYDIPGGLPVEAIGSSANWMSEAPGSDEAASDMTTSNIELVLHTLHAGSGFSKQLLRQSRPSRAADQAVVASIVGAFAEAFDAAGIAGSGTGNEPTGILNTTGINVVALGANGAVPGWADMVELEYQVAVDDADRGNIGLLSTPAIRKLLRQTEKTAGSGLIWEDDQVLGHPATVSTNVPSNLTKGTGTNLHALIFANFADLVLAHLPFIDLVVDPITKGRQALVEVEAFMFVDIALLHAVSFAAIKDAALS